ncbi:unannotated protein [freshwater metagenome]|uniref:Unannotated protein n=1 Tax=freshwater metagenome TaxID=449393 RepID=A0A6J7DSJ4_9ZZZZ|nr:transcriptional repressor [Actinomycetota bacterium]
MKSTRQRTAICEILDSTSQFQSAQEIFASLQQRKESVGLTTVYRVLQTLVDSDEVDALRRDDGEMMYRRCTPGQHHHHLICRSCGRTIEVEGASVERWAQDVAAKNGFSQVSHVVEIFGVCTSCRS